MNNSTALTGRQWQVRLVSTTITVTSDVVAGLVFLLVIPLLCHLAFSALGFNPTDDGFTLAYSRRLLEGQLPHRDFIIIRPALSPLLHVGELWLGGEYVYLLSRYVVWVELAGTAWAGITVLEKVAQQQLHSLAKGCLAFVSMVLATHTFPLMAWHTIDGLFLLTIGLRIIVERNGKAHWGYFVVGLAYLCKQSFLLAGPLLLLILSDARHVKNWIAVGLPGMLYVSILAAGNALPNALLQLTTQSDFATAGIDPYYSREVLLAIIVGFALAYTLHSNTGMRTRRVLYDLGGAVAFVLLVVVPGFITADNWLTGTGILSYSFSIFGLVLGLGLFWMVPAFSGRNSLWQASLIAIVTAWSASISVGYPFPTLGSGQLISCLVVVTWPFIQRKLDARVHTLLIAILAISLVYPFSVARTRYIYREASVAALTWPLDDVLPGGAGIRTNGNLHAFLSNLRETSESIANTGKTYSILPDCPGYWVSAAQTNPLPIDWPQSTELNRQSLIDQVVGRLEQIRETNVVLVQKDEVGGLASGRAPLRTYAVVEYVKEHFDLIGETEWLYIYK